MPPSNQDENGGLTEDRLAYGLLGKDESTALEKLDKYTGEVDWNALSPHFASGALVYVDSSLSLTEVGHAFSEDNAEQVRKWRKAGDLLTPSRPHADYWEESGARFQALVVSPFVLIQEVNS